MFIFAPVSLNSDQLFFLFLVEVKFSKINDGTFYSSLPPLIRVDNPWDWATYFFCINTPLRFDPQHKNATFQLYRCCSSVTAWKISCNNFSLNFPLEVCVYQNLILSGVTVNQCELVKTKVIPDVLRMNSSLCWSNSVIVVHFRYRWSVDYCICSFLQLEITWRHIYYHSWLPPTDVTGICGLSFSPCLSH